MDAVQLNIRTKNFFKCFDSSTYAREALAHHKHLLHFGDALAKNGPQLVTYSSQQEAKQGDSQQCVDDAEDPSSFRVGGDIPKTWKQNQGYKMTGMTDQYNNNKQKANKMKHKCKSSFRLWFAIPLSKCIQPM